MNYFKKNLRYLIKRYDTTQARLALQLNKGQNTISNWINENSYPDVPELAEIHRIFGVSLDALVFVDLENSNLITDAHVQEFVKNGNVKRNLSGNLKAVSKEYFMAENQPFTEAREPDQVGIWAVLGQLKNMDQKIDLLVVSAENKPKKARK